MPQMMLPIIPEGCTESGRADVRKVRAVDLHPERPVSR